MIKLHPVGAQRATNHAHCRRVWRSKLNVKKRLNISTYISLLEPNETHYRVKLHQNMASRFQNIDSFLSKLEIRSVERGICPIAKSTMSELFL